MRRMIRCIKDLCLWFVWFPVRWVVCILPLAWSYRAAGLAAHAVYWLCPHRRRVMRDEIGALYAARFERKDISGIVKRSLAVYLKRQVENMLLGTMTEERLARWVTAEGAENVEEALKGGKGVIILLAHFGSFLLPLPWLGHRGYDVVQVTGKPILEGRSWVYRKIFELRKKESTRLPIRFIQTDRYLGPIVKALRSNGIVALAFDGRSSDTWIETKLLARTATFSPGPFNLASRTGAVILPTYVIRQRDNTHRLVFSPPFALESAEEHGEELRRNTLKYARLFEDYISRYPCHFATTLYSVRREAERGENPPLFVD